MPAQDTIYARRQLHKLYTEPLSVLSSNIISVGGLAGNDTQSVPLYFGARLNEIRIGMDQRTADHFLFIGAPVDDRSNVDAVVRCTGLASPMRGHIASNANRLNQTIQVQPGANKLWVTDQQTGCSVLILKWPGGFFSMIHLQPNGDSEFNQLGDFINRSDLGLAVQKNAWLRPELTEVTARSGNGNNPEAYILVQSLHIARAGACQVIGVNVNGTFEFYLQKVVVAGSVFNLSAQRMQWTPWRDYIPYLTY
ncbi:MAG: hypothetical protein ABW069_04135 [Duganella sp.]